MKTKQFTNALKLIKEGKLERVVSDDYNLVPNHPYLFVTIETESSGRKVYYEVEAIAGYYNPKPSKNADEDDENDDTKIRVVLNNAIMLGYTSKVDTAPFDYMEEHGVNPGRYEETDVFITSNTDVYKLPFKPIRKERVRTMKKTLEEMRWAPIASKVTFIGEHYRTAKRKYEENVANGKYVSLRGGRKTRKRTVRD